MMGDDILNNKQIIHRGAEKVCKENGEVIVDMNKLLYK